MDRKTPRPTSMDGVYRLPKVAPVEATKKTPSPQPHQHRTPTTPETNPLFNKTPQVNGVTPKPYIQSQPIKSAPVERRGSRKNRGRRRKDEKRPWSTKRKVLTSALTILLIGFGLGGWYGAKLVGNLDKVFHGNIVSDVSALVSQTTLKGESSGRVNILVAGDSADDPGHGGADLTDSIMLLSINTKSHTAFMLSIPRDLWVNIPSIGNQKINAANNVTSFSAAGYPKGGMGQLEQIVQTDLGIPVDYYALVNYEAFKDSVNAVGGITVDIQSPNPRGLYDQFTNLKLPNGEDFLDGQEALNLARARGDVGDDNYGFPDTDFDRTEHQRQEVVAIAKKATSIGVISNPVRVSQLFSALSNNVQTDFTLQDALRFAQITKGINLSTMGSYTYSSTTTGATSALLTAYTDPDSGQEALIPMAGLGNYGQLQEYYEQLTSSNPVVKEGASVTILNASDVIGLAKNEENVLNTQGVDNVTIADANNEHPNTMIIDNSAGKDPNTKRLLEKLFPGTVVTSDTSSSEAEEAQGYTSNFVVVLGQNWDGTQVNN